MVAAALEAAQALAAEGVQARVLDMHTVRPLDVAAVTKAARETGKIVVAEEHLVQCGLGSVVAMAVAEHAPCGMAFVGVENTYAESGECGSAPSEVRLDRSAPCSEGPVLAIRPSCAGFCRSLEMCGHSRHHIYSSLIRQSHRASV